MILRQPEARVALAIALSLAIHAALLLSPKLFDLPVVETRLPPLLAKLEPLPAAIPKPPKPEPPKPAKPKPVKPKPAVTSAPIIPADTPVVPVEAAVDEPIAEEPVANIDVPQETEALIPVAAEQSAHPLPLHAQLTFQAYMGTSMVIGNSHHQLSIDGNYYDLKVDVSTIGLASLFKKFEMIQKSEGTVSASGLHPTKFSESRVTSKGLQEISARFDWENKQLSFSNGSSTALPEQAQDILSSLYQLSQLPLNQAVVSIDISNGKKLEHYELEVGAEEEIITRMGKLRALPLRKLHAPGEEGQIIWLGLEYRLLPVKIRQIDRNGEIAGEMVVTEIRVSEE